MQTLHRTHQRRDELETARLNRRDGPPDQPVSEREPDQRLFQSGGAAVNIAWDWCAACRQGYDADWFRNALIAREIQPCIPSRRNRKVAIPHDPTLCKARHKIETMFARLKGWRRIATRYDRCADIFMSACARAALAIFWI